MVLHPRDRMPWREAHAGGILVPRGHRFAEVGSIAVAVLAEGPLLLAEEARAPEFNQFTVELCRAAGFTPAVYGEP